MGRLGRVNTGVQCSQGRSGAGTFLTYTPVRGHTGTFRGPKTKSFGLPKCCMKNSLEYCFKKVDPFPRAHSLPETLLLGEEAPGKVPRLPPGLQDAAKREKPQDGHKRMVSPCQVIPGHIQINTLCSCQLEKGTSTAPSLLCTTCSPHTGARPETCWESWTGRLHSPTSPWQLKESPTVNVLLSRRGLYRNQPFLQESSSRISSSC